MQDSRPKFVNRILIMKVAYFDQPKNLPGKIFLDKKIFISQKELLLKNFPGKNFVSSKDSVENFESNDA